MINNKGQQMTLGTIIAIVLGIAVLVFLIFGFSSGWSNLWDRVTNFVGGSSNIDTIKQSCALACAGQSKDAFCNQERTVKFGKEVTISVPGELKEGEIGAPSEAVKRKIKTTVGTCNLMVNNDSYYPGVVVDACPGLC